MEYFAGLDVAQAETAICISDKDGNIIREAMVNTEPDDIAVYIKGTNLHLKRVGMEASNLSIWLYRELCNRDLPALCIETRHAKAAMAAQNVKTDKNDARCIAHMMRTGWFKPVHVKSDENQRLKMLVNNRKTLVWQRVKMESQIRGTLKVFGLKTGEITRCRFAQRVRELISGDGELEAGIEPLLEVRAVIMAQTQQLEKMILTAVKNDDVCRRLMSIPGVGPLTALLFKAVIDDPSRFKKSRDVPVHLGITPRKYASGEVDYTGRITKCGDRLLRTHLFEAAAYILRPSSKKSSLKAWGTNISKRSCLRKARVAVSRRLAIIMHRMWVDGTEFETGMDTAV